MDLLLQDIRQALRKLARTPSFTLIVLATLALAIGATTAVFSVVNGVILNPLGFAKPGQLMYIAGVSPTGGTMSISPQDLLDYRARSTGFSDMAAVEGGRGTNLVRNGAPAVRTLSARVGGSFFSILGLEPQLGRLFVDGDDAADAAKVVVLSDAAWRRSFGGDQRVIGQHVTLDENEYTIIGVAPPEMDFPSHTDLWLPAVWRSWEIGDAARGFHSIHAIARLRDGVPLARAQRELAGIAAQIAQAFPKNDARVSASATPLRDQLVGDVSRPLWAMFGAVLLVLLIACVNVANLVLVRGVSRTPEIAVRVALGASARRLLRQSVIESLLLTVGGTIIGTFAASWAIDAVIAIGPAALPRLHEITIDQRVLALNALIAIATGLLFAVLPGLRVSQADVSLTLRSGGRTMTRDSGRARSALVFAELALGTVLLVGAALLLRSFQRLTHVDPGFRADHLIVFDAALVGKKYDYDAATNAYTDEAQSRLRAIPGVQSVGISATRPFDPQPGFSASAGFTVDGAPKPVAGLEPESQLIPVSPSFFQAAGVQIQSGRTFTDQDDRRDAAPVVVVNQALAAKYFPGQNPIGKHITFGLSHNVSAAPGDTLRARGEIIGVVRDAKLSSLASAADPATYLPFRLLPLAPTFLVRTSGDPTAVERAIRREMRAVDPVIPIYELGTMDDALADSVAQPRFFTVLLSAFAAVALLLAALGIYGVISHAVTQRLREFGIRIALGATARDVASLVVRRGAWLTAAGLAGGVVGAAAATRVMRQLLFGVAPLDPLSFVGACVVLGGVATLASWIPARRAARVDPVVAMRAD
jgi:putative ABC transport system permease protein